MQQVLRGKPEPVALALVALLSGGHLLVEDVPGVGKTLLAKALARSVGGVFRRVQCTPDLLPSELTGVSVFHLAGNEWEFRPGPLFAHVVLVDELNRATPAHPVRAARGDGGAPGHRRRRDAARCRTRSSSSRRRTRTRRPAPSRSSRASSTASRSSRTSARPIPRPSAQLLLGEGGEDALADLAPVSDPVALADAIAHGPPDPLRAERRRLRDRASPTRPATIPTSRSAPARAPASRSLHAAQAHALLDGRSYVVPDDVKRLAVPVLAHRLMLRDPATLREAQTFLAALVEGVAVPHP